MPTTPDVRAAYLDKVYVSATSTTPPDEANLVDGIDTCDVSRKSTTVAQNYLSDDGNEKTASLRKSGDISMSGHNKKGNPAQTALRDGYLNGTRVYVTIIEDAAATAGSQGMQYPCKVESFNESRKSTDLVGFNAALKFDGAPVAV